VVQPWWGEYVEAARYGAPPHVTVLFPLLPIISIDGGIVEELGMLVGTRAPFEVEFSGCARFPGVLYLEPTPDEPFRGLTAAIARHWPQVPPYGGQFDDPTPHLTVSHTVDPARFDEIEADVSTRLPLRTKVDHVELLAFDGRRWRRRHRLPLAATNHHT
jgi:hypothetical protein